MSKQIFTDENLEMSLVVNSEPGLVTVGLISTNVVAKQKLAEAADLSERQLAKFMDSDDAQILMVSANNGRVPQFGAVKQNLRETGVEFDGEVLSQARKAYDNATKAMDLGGPNAHR